MLEIYKAIILGVVEGFTEFIPVSSTGHLIIVGDLIEFSGEFSKTFNISIQLGAILSVLIIFRRNFRSYFSFRPNLKINPNILHIIIISIPAFFAGYFLHSFIKLHLFTPFTVAVGLILGSFLMIYADMFEKKHKNVKVLTYKKSFILGLFQCLALWPGMSRSGSTISGGILLGLDHKKASSYSFICAVPIILGATVYELIKSNISFDINQIKLLIIGFIISFFLGWLSILFFLKLISKIKLKPFAIYRIIIAIIILFSSKLEAKDNSNIFLIQTSRNISINNELTSKQEDKIIDKYFNIPSSKYLYLTSNKNLIKKNRYIDLGKMYIEIKTLPKYLFIKEGESKTLINELIIGGPKSYKLYSESIKNIGFLKSFLNKYKIKIKKDKRYYINFCLDQDFSKNILWSLEFLPAKDKINILKTPKTLMLKNDV